MKCGLEIEVVRAALRAVRRIVAVWELGEADIEKILGIQYITEDRIDVGVVELERISLVIGIYAGLHTIYGDDVVADGWLRRPNSNTVFGGRCPLEVMRSGLGGMYLVRRYLDSRL